MISDDVFRLALDRAFKEQKLKKKDRNERIAVLMLADRNERDGILDREERLGRDAKEKDDEPPEAYEQKELVSWFRQTYPGVLIFHIPNGGYRFFIEGMNLKAQGIVPGIPDLYVPEWRLWVEMKRKKGWELSEEQEQIRRYLTEKCEDSFILGIGFEDAKEKIIKFLQK